MAPGLELGSRWGRHGCRFQMVKAGGEFYWESVRGGGESDGAGMSLGLWCS